MRGLNLLCLLASLCICDKLCSQVVYTIKADSVKITNCDSAELILENHTQNVPGFLFNTGNGRTIFKRGLQGLGNGSYLLGADTLKAWIQGGNSFGTTGILGTLDNNPLDLYSNGSQRMRLTPAGSILFGSSTDNGYNTFQFNGSIYDTLGYFSNFTSPFLGGNNSGAIRLRWGTGDGVYMAFFYQGNTNRRAYMSTPADNRAFYINDQVGITTGNTPYVSIGTEGSLNSKFCVYNPGSSLNDMTIARLNASDSLVYDFLVSSTGNVGIGTVTPQYPLDVNGDVNIGGSGQLRMLSHRSGINATCLSTHLYNGCGSVGYITLGFNNTSGTSSGIPDPLTLSQKVMSVGINTINPLAKLHVTGGDTSSSSSSFLVNNAVGKESLRVLDDGRIRLASLVNDTTQTRVLVSDDSGNVYYRSVASLASNDFMHSSLTVNGTIKSKKIIISPDDWADYVFDSTYRLPALGEVESYIHREHHLPGIPSAAAVRKDSLDVGTGQAALLKKIEELTLYTIDQDRRLKDQKNEIEGLRNEIQELKQLIRSKISK